MFFKLSLFLYTKISILAFFLSLNINANNAKIAIKEQYLNDALNLINQSNTEHEIAKKLQYFVAVALLSTGEGFVNTQAALNKINFDIPTQPNCLSSGQIKDLLKIADNIFAEPKKVFIDKIALNNQEHLENIIINALSNNLPVLVKINTDEKKDWHIVTRFDKKKIEIISSNLQVISTTKEDFFNKVVQKNIILFKYTFYANMHGYNKPCNLL